MHTERPPLTSDQQLALSIYRIEMAQYYENIGNRLFGLSIVDLETCIWSFGMENSINNISQLRVPTTMWESLRRGESFSEKDFSSLFIAMLGENEVIIDENNLQWSTLRCIWCSALATLIKGSVVHTLQLRASDINRYNMLVSGHAICMRGTVCETKSNHSWQYPTTSSAVKKFGSYKCKCCGKIPMPDTIGSCLKCRSVFYCSRTCFMNDAGSHEKDCDGFRKNVDYLCQPPSVLLTFDSSNNGASPGGEESDIWFEMARTSEVIPRIGLTKTREVSPETDLESTIEVLPETGVQNGQPSWKSFMFPL